MNKLRMAVLLVTSLCCVAREISLKRAEVPLQVRDACAGLYPGGAISHWSKESENGHVTYEASVKDGAEKRDVVFTSEGSLVATEESIPVSQLPLPVSKRLLEKYPKAHIRRAEEISHDGKIDYEVDLSQSVMHEVTISADGRILKEE